MPKYDSSFFEYVNSGSLASAERLLPVLLDSLPITSVLDVGCGQGAWLSIWNKLGVEDVCGIDGSYVDRSKLLVSDSLFQPLDLTTRFHMKRRYDLAQSLEVAEHLPKAIAPQFVDCLCAHSDLVLFSAAPPGQGGDHHVNEQPYEYWRKLFMRHNYVPIDYIRPLVAGELRIEPWYRYNTFLYSSEESLTTLPPNILQARVPANVELQDISPLAYRLRKAFVSLLPVTAVTVLAKVKERRMINMRKDT